MPPAKRGRPNRPATTPEGRENQLISLAVDLAERQLRDGTAPASTVAHFLKMSSSREQLEQERLQHDNLLISAKVEQLRSQKKIEELYSSALDAMRQYSGGPNEGYDDDDFDEEML